MRKKHVDREKQLEQIIASAPYQSGDGFRTPVMAAILNLSVSATRDLLNHLTAMGLVTKRLERFPSGGPRSGTAVYSRPAPTILRKAWRKHSNESMGLVEQLGIRT